MTKFKILTVTPFFPPDIGGLSYHVQNLNLNLVKQNNNVSIVAPKHLTQETPSPDDVLNHVFRIPAIYLPGWPYPTLRSVSIPIDLGLKIKSLIQNGKFDLVHAHGHHYPISWIAINAAHKYRIPSILTLHGVYGLNPNVLGGKSQIEDLFNKQVFAKILSKTNTVIGLTSKITDYAKMYGTSSTKYFTIPNGVNTSLFKDNFTKKKEFREKYHINQNSLVILFSTRFEVNKGIIEFTHAVKQIIKKENIEVVIVGQGSLESFVRTNLGGINGIHILKWHPPEKIHEIYIASDIFIIPSQWEGLPLTLIEAMNAGLHIVYTPVGGIPEIIKDYSPKTLLSKVASDEIFNVLNKLISNFPSENINDSLSYAQKFDWKEIAVDTLRAYEECVNKKHI